MALPSQMDRSTETARQGSRKPATAGGGKIIGGAIVAVAAVGLVWGAIHFMGKPKQGAQPEAPKDEKPKEVTGGTPAVTPKTPAGNPGGPLSDAIKPQPTEQTGTTATSLPDAPKPTPVDVTKNPNQPTQGATPAGTSGTGAPTGTNTGTTPGANGANPGAAPANALPASESSSAVRSLVESGERAMAAGKLVEARALLSKALLHPDSVKSDLPPVREKLAKINEDLVFSKKITASDPMVEQYTVVSGDALEKISRRRDLLTRWELIMRVNGISDPGALKIGQKLKLVRGPFHAVVSKSDYRLDLFWGSPDDPENWIFVKSFTVGLGEGNGTPIGTFTIKNRMKNPSWKNPRTGEYFEANDPKNPIGEYWLGWTGQGAASVHVGFGLHGTIDPGSIGQQKSMGCLLKGDADIAMIWEFLSEQVSVVRVQN